MGEITQGSIVYGVRSNLYLNTNCCAIIISAKCDLAQKKTEKVFYLEALPLYQWLISKKGIDTISTVTKNNKRNSMSKYDRAGLNIDTLLSFSEEEAKVVIYDPELDLTDKERRELMEGYQEYQYISELGSGEDALSRLLGKDKNVKKRIKEITDGKNTHLCFIPEDAYKNNGCFNDGLLVDLQQIDFFTVEEIELIVRCQIDSKTLSIEEMTQYDKKFCLSMEPGYAIVAESISSPWIEYIMQKFSNSFIRIGVDNMQEKHIEEFLRKNGISEEAI